MTGLYLFIVFDWIYRIMQNFKVGLKYNVYFILYKYECLTYGMLCDIIKEQKL